MPSYMVYVQSGMGKGSRFAVSATDLKSARAKAQKKIKKTWGSQARKILVRRETKYT